MTRIRFTKMHGAGNDFVVIDCRDGDPVEDWEAFARYALDRRFGIGGDQLLLVQPSRRADLFMGIHNPDGSRAEMCANGVRAFYRYVRERGILDREEIEVETLAGVVRPRQIAPEAIEVRMTPPVLDPEKIPTTLRGDIPLVEISVQVDGKELRVTPVSMGNPHCVVFVDDPERVAVSELGPALETHPAFPERTNVEFVGVRSRRELSQRTWERGTGETLACGSGACAAAVAAVLAGRSEREVQIRLRGGELGVRWPDADGPVWLRGPATRVFEGEIEIR